MADRVAVEVGAPLLSGYLERPEGWLKSFRRRFFELREGQLFYFQSEAEAPGGASMANGCLAVRGAQLRALEPGQASGRAFAIGLTQACSTRMYIMLAPSEQARIEWLSALVHAGASVADGDRTKSPASAGAGNSMSGGRHASVSSTSAPRMFSVSSHEGWLLKLGGVQKTTFQPRYFVLLGQHLGYFKHPSFPDDGAERESARGQIHLAGATLTVVDHAERAYGHRHVFSIQPLVRPNSSLFSSLFGEVLRKFVFVAKDETDLHTWIQKLKEAMEGTTLIDDGSDMSDDDLPGSATVSASHTPATGASDLTASLTSTDHFASPSAAPAAAYTSLPSSDDYMSHLLTQQGDSPHAASLAEWKQRYCSLSVQGKVLRMWKHKPSGRSALKPKLIDVSSAAVHVHKLALSSCSKTVPVPVLTLRLPAEDGSSKPSYLHLAPPTQARFDSWYSFLSLVVGQAPRTRTNTRDTGNSERERDRPTESAASSIAKAAAAAVAARANLQKRGSNAQAPPSASSPPSESRARRMSRQEVRPPAPSSPLAPPPAAVPAAAHSSPKTSAQLLAEMSDALGDADAMAVFRARSVELHKGVLPVPAYFRAYFRTFGRQKGLRFWHDLLAIVPREEVRQELRQLFEQHKHLFEPKQRTPHGRGSGNVVGSAPSQRHVSISSDKESSDASSSDDEDHGALPSFTFAPPTSAQAAEWFPASPLSSSMSGSPSPLTPPPVALGGAPAPTPASAPAPTPAPAPLKMPPKSSRTSTPVSTPTAAAAAASSSAPVSTASVTPLPPHPPQPFQETESELQDRVSGLVRAWSVRCEHHVLTLLCTLHEILPSTVAPGAFIPFSDAAPTLREVHRTYLKALRVLHPDKTKAQPHHIQALSAAVFQCVGAAWEKYERAEKRKQRKEAEKAVAAERTKQ